MYTHQLKYALKTSPVTRDVSGGVFPRDKIPKIPKKTSIAYIFNTDPSYKNGQHWIAFYLTIDTVYYFDSYGLAPKGFKKILKSRRNCVHFPRRLQGNDEACGYYCLYFIYAMQTHRDFSQFSSDLTSNDMYVRRYVERRFPV
jgi:hypothetical protein